MSKNILIITTNSSEGEKIKNTGINLQEFAEVYLIFEKTGYKITTASLLGGLSPIDENSMSCSNPMEWDKCIKILRNTEKIYNIDYKDYDALYFPGGHGVYFDLMNNETIKQIIEYFYSKNKIISAICHGVGILIQAQDENKIPILKNRKVTSITNKEEKIIKYQDLVPFLIETKLRNIEVDFVEEKPWEEHVEVDCKIITGQNQNSATLLAEKIIKQLQ